MNQWKWIWFERCLDISSSNRICLAYEKNEHMNFLSHRHHEIKVKRQIRESSFYSCRRTLVALIWLRKSRLISLNIFNTTKGLLLTAICPLMDIFSISTKKNFSELDSVIIQYLIDLSKRDGIMFFPRVRFLFQSVWNIWGWNLYIARIPSCSTCTISYIKFAFLIRVSR
jgi:hypothetical protein